MRRYIFCLFFLPALLHAETTKKVFNPFTGTFDFITQLDSTTLPSGSTQYIQNSGVITDPQNFSVSSGTSLGGFSIRGALSVNDPYNNFSNALTYDPSIFGNSILSLKAPAGFNYIQFLNGQGEWAELEGLGGSTHFFALNMSSNGVTSALPTSRWTFYGDLRGSNFNDYLGNTVYSILSSSTLTNGTIIATNGVKAATYTATSFGSGVVQADSNGNFSSSALSLTSGPVTGITAFVQNTLSPTTTTQVFSVMTSSVSGNAYVVGNLTTNGAVSSPGGGSLSEKFGAAAAAGGLQSTSLGNTSSAAGDYSVAFGYSASAALTNSSAFGAYSNASGTLATAIGRSALSSGQESTAIGQATTASALDSQAIGYSASASATNSTAIGAYAAASVGTGATAIGRSSIASNSQTTALGYLAQATGINGTAFGQNAAASATSAGAFGKDAAASNTSTLAMGTSATASASASTAIGVSASATGINSFALGGSANASGTYAIAIGHSAASAYQGAIALGESAATTATNQLVFGSSPAPINTVFFGKGVTDTAPTAITINGTGGSGSNVAGSDLILAGGKGTGNAASGLIIFQTSDAGASGSTAESLTTKMIISSSSGTVWSNSSNVAVASMTTGGVVYVSSLALTNAGITFPDGSYQSTASSGGGDGNNFNNYKATQALSMGANGIINIGSSSSSFSSAGGLVVNSSVTIVGSVIYPYDLIAGTSTTVNSFHVAVSTMGSFMVGGSTPSLSSCGTGPTFGTSSPPTNNAGQIVTGTGVGSCTLNWLGGSWLHPPHCVVNDDSDTSNWHAGIATLTAITFTTTALPIGSTTLEYICLGT